MATLTKSALPLTDNTDNIPALARLLAQTLQQQCASDLHATPEKEQYHIKIRRHGLLESLQTIDTQTGLELINHWKVLARLDLTLKSLPQDGSILAKQQSDISLRISTCPTLFGEKVVLRLHPDSASTLALDQLGMTPSQQQQYAQALQKSSGLILIAGPTGSGKTTTLYAGLNQLKNQPLHLVSIEDPVEVHIPHVTQINVNTSFDFASALRTVLRQDPDVVMIGEIRDKETAEIAISAAQTGHLVLATVHAADTAGALMRLQNLGACLQQLEAQLLLLISQNLDRMISPAGDTSRTGQFEVLSFNQHQSSPKVLSALLKQVRS